MTFECATFTLKSGMKKPKCFQTKGLWSPSQKHSFEDSDKLWASDYVELLTLENKIFKTAYGMMIFSL